MSNNSNSLIRKPQSSATSPQLMDVDQGQRQSFEPESPEHPQKPANALLVLHSLLRGRYWLAIGLAVVLAASGAPLGYNAVKPKYKGTGMVRIYSYKTPIVKSSEFSDVIPFFQQYMEGQILIMQNSGLVKQAIQDPRWQEVEPGTSTDDVERFVGRLEITHQGEYITVNFLDTNPEATYRGVNALIDTFQANFNRLDNQNLAERMQALKTLQKEKSEKWDAKNKEIFDIGRAYGSTSLEKWYNLQLENLQQVKTQLTAAQLALATTEARMKNSSAAPSARGSVGINDLAPPDAAPEEVLKNLIHQRMDEASRLGRLLITYGENHDEVTKSRTFIASMDRQIQQLYAQINSGAGSANVSALAASLQSLRTNEATIRKMYEDLQKEVQEVGEKNWQILNLRSEADKLQSELNEIKSTIERLTVEEAVGGRLAVINYGELPRHPDKDRRAALAGAGGFGGAVLGFAIIALWGLLDGRMRQIADARSQLPRFSKLLGVLPSLPENLSDPAQSAIAAHCVHQIRTLLQIQQGANGHRVLAVTSPSPGDGKTSLTIALGLSFAASGAKTLLIDCDMYGRRLTARLTSSGVRKLGQILLYNRRISDEQLSQALERARCAGRKLGETLIDMHAVNEKDVAHALGVQARMDAGLFGAIRGDQLADCVLRTGVSNLHLMPLGTDDPRQAALITPISMRPILDEAARQFDVVLVDTGPILGSSEAAVIASEVDGVVLTISRGGQRNLAQNAVNYLNSMNAHLEGIVFNRARPDDILRSGYSSSVSMSPGEKDKPEKTHEATTAGAGHWPKRLGPVAHAVSSESPTLRPPGDEKNS